MSEPPPDAPTDQQLPLVLNAELLDQVLATDLANIVAKATRGLPLTAREREMIEAERARLGDSEPTPPRAADDFRLDADGPCLALERMTQRELADEWGVSVRTIKGWIAAGVDAKDPAPLTRPEKFPAWFERIHAPRKCPEKYRLAAQRLMAGSKASAEKPALPSSPPPERAVIDNEAKGLLAMLERHRETEARLGQDYMKAVDSGDEVRASFLLSQWSSMGEKLRALEKIAPKALEELGIYVRKDEIQRELEPIHRAVVKTFRQELRLCRPRLRATQTPDEWNLLIDEIVDGVSALLTNSEFSEPLILDPET